MKPHEVRIYPPESDFNPRDDWRVVSWRAIAAGGYPICCVVGVGDDLAAAIADWRSELAR